MPHYPRQARDTPTESKGYADAQVSAMTPDIDPAVELVIERTANEVERRFTATLDTKLAKMREEYRTCATCSATHVGVDKATSDNAADIEKLAKTVDDLTKKVYMGVGIAALIPTAVAFLLHFAK